MDLNDPCVLWFLPPLVHRTNVRKIHVRCETYTPSELWQFKVRVLRASGQYINKNSTGCELIPLIADVIEERRIEIAADSVDHATVCRNDVLI